jgi:hypothetical protein
MPEPKRCKAGGSLSCPRYPERKMPLDHTETIIWVCFRSLGPACSVAASSRPQRLYDRNLRNDRGQTATVEPGTRSMKSDQHGLKQSEADEVSAWISKIAAGMALLFAVFAVGDWFELFPHIPERPQQIRWLSSLHL